MKNTLMFLVFGVVISQSVFAVSAPFLRTRCSDDSLDVQPAIERTEWATRCGHISGTDRQYALFDNGQPRPRPMYPLFSKEDLKELWVAPVDRSAPCSVPSGMQVMAFCTSSCYTPEQAVLFPEGFVSIKEAKDRQLPELMALEEESTLEQPILGIFAVESYTEEFRNTWHDILHFKMQSGGELRVTTNHPIISETGAIKSADKFKVGQKLIHFEKGPDEIVAIDPVRYHGKVYNLAPTTRVLTSNVLIAQGYLNASSYYQNDGVNFLNRVILRRTVPNHLLK